MTVEITTLDDGNRTAFIGALGRVGMPVPKILHLTAEQLINAGQSPVELLPAGGPNTVVFPVTIAYRLTAGATPFRSHGSGAFRYGASGGTLMDANASSTILSETDALAVSSGFTFSGVPEDYVNLPLTFDAPFEFGVVTAHSINTAGAGYQVGDWLFLDQAGADFLLTVTAVDENGGVTAYTAAPQNHDDLIAAPGADLATGYNDSGAGAGLTLDITGVTQGDGALEIVIVYQIIDP